MGVVGGRVAEILELDEDQIPMNEDIRNLTESQNWPFNGRWCRPTPHPSLSDIGCAETLLLHQDVLNTGNQGVCGQSNTKDPGNSRLRALFMGWEWSTGRHHPGEWGTKQVFEGRARSAIRD